MEEKSGTFKIDHYVELVLKHRWLIIIPFCLAMLTGIVLIICAAEELRDQCIDSCETAEGSVGLCSDPL